MLSQTAWGTGFFDPERLRGLARQHADEYSRARPFPNVVLDDFADENDLDAMLEEFPTPPAGAEGEEHGRGKTGVDDELLLGPVTRQFIRELNSSFFLEFLESLTGIRGLIPDPHLVGGGLHQTTRGGFLRVHADFNWHERLLLDRRLNLILYLNRDWKENYGGHLELWTSDMSRCERRVLPVFNRCVVFSTTDSSYHGHPDPLTCPDAITRKSIALYYYSNGRPAAEVSPSHLTLFKARPGEVMRRSSGGDVRNWARQLVPPIVLEAAGRARARLGRRS
jgi:Rps23 Pro-64 3,4-dihydroxylase Tpa1-like proline 4-hydroxylase